MRTIHVFTVTKEAVVEIEDDDDMSTAVELARDAREWKVAQCTFLTVEPQPAPAPPDG